MNSDQYVFLTSCYHQNIDELRVYREFLSKFILDKAKGSFSPPEIRKAIIKDYGVSIPSNTISLILKQLARKNEGIEFSNIEEKLRIKEIPEDLKSRHEKSLSDFESSVSRVLGGFNKFLKENEQSEITGKELILLIRNIRLYLVNKKSIPHSAPEISKVFAEWISIVHNSSDNHTLQDDLNRLLFAFLLYYYFAELKTPNQKLSTLSIFIDTNILVYLYGINGRARKAYIEELFALIKENNCKIVISYESLNELSDFLSSPGNHEVISFKKEHPDLSEQLIGNTRSQVELTLQDYGIDFEFNSSSIIRNRDYFPEWDNFVESLAKFKRKRRGERIYSEFSLNHDINLVFISEVFISYFNIYDHKRIVGTADNLFTRWFYALVRRRMLSRTSGIMNLEKLTLFLHFEGSQNSQERFLSKTWAYVVDRIPYFSEGRSNAVFRLLRESREKQQIPKDWRSTYLVLKNRATERYADNFSDIDSKTLAEEIKGLGYDLIGVQSDLEKEKKRADNAESEAERLRQKYEEAIRQRDSVGEELKEAKRNILFSNITDFLIRYISWLKRFFGL